MKKLIDLLKSIPKGPAVAVSNLEPFIIDCWDDLSGSGDGGMTAYKLLGRIEKPYWDPPILTFEIERHGGFVSGSSRAEIQKWELNMDKGTASYEKTGHRQLKPMQPRLDVKPIAEEVARLIENHEDDERLRWNEDGSVKVQISKIIPESSGVKRTVMDRRKRFRKELDELLTSAGWKRINYNYYKPDK